MNIRDQLTQIVETWDEDPFPILEISYQDPNVQLFTRAATGPKPLKYDDHVFWIWDYRYEPRTGRFIFVLDLNRFDEIKLTDLYG